MVKTRITEGVTANDPKTKRWRSLFSSARMAYADGQFKQAESLLARAALIATELPEREYAEKTTEVAAAVVLLAAKRIVEAMARLKKSITELEGSPDNLHKELLAVALRFYAQALIEHGSERDAEMELKRSLEILSKLGPEARVQQAYSYCDLGGLYLKQGRYSEGEHNVIKGLKIISQELGPESAEYTRADMIYQLCLPMNEETRMDSVSDALEKMQYGFGFRHPNIDRAVTRYLHVLSERGNKEKLEETKKKFNISLVQTK